MFLRANVKGSSKSRLVNDTLFTEFWIATALKLLKNLFRLWGIFLPNLRILSRKNNQPIWFILSLAMTVTTNTSDRPNLSLVHAWKSIKKRFSLVKKENSALSEHTCLTNHTVGRDSSKIITTNRRYQQCFCLEAWHINSAHAPLTRDDGGLLPDAYLHLVRKKRQLISDHIKGPLLAAFRSPLMKALDRSVETLGLWIVTSSVTFVKSVNQSGIKPCLIDHQVAVWTLMYFKQFMFAV